ncbi:hypothetical protein [Pseudobacteriovorax antillogorgiicola]|uniref:Uncharacterized protein n=1 Tax=Pseudobacteriovorax antillogorgiicola TaxID=1513793 RepID=A0A1Y6CSW5_9BACT|nr:hypothetical protein [Pseudobacteriovorax antillogorgiicola]TCS45434.1 hypothetical protein EDD56_12845 [Pseudobacteriovorax antillogorgiicola]SMF74449.1 hypothetical protein SAMN06296036_12845 [Pseudobacteriovorax antillogorgiicola]
MTCYTIGLVACFFWLFSTPILALNLECQGTLNPNRQVTVSSDSGKIIGKIYEGNTLLRQGTVSPFKSVDKPGGAGESRKILRSGNPLRGGFHIRLVEKNAKFPNKAGQGHVTFKHEGRTFNDIIRCKEKKAR